jgi:hypothetical protein
LLTSAKFTLAADPEISSLIIVELEMEITNANKVRKPVWSHPSKNSFTYSKKVTDLNCSKAELYTDFYLLTRILL